MLHTVLAHPRWTIAALTALGLLLRSSGLSSSSMTHYDEFYYAHSGLWMVVENDLPLRVKGASAELSGAGASEPVLGIHPMLPFHAPLLYPTLIGVMYRLIGGLWYPAGAVVSALLGTATIPLVYLLGRRVGGPSTALLAAFLMALSDFHVTYSRMWLTDATLGFFFTATMYCLVRRWDGGCWSWAVLAGIATGFAWNTKYNGWMPVAMALLAWLFLKIRASWQSRRMDGVAAQVVPPDVQPGLSSLAFTGTIALVMFLPWFVYVEKHFPGGYASVVGHHRTFSNLAKVSETSPRGFLGPMPLLQPAWATATQLWECLPAYRHWGWCLTLLLLGVGFIALLTGRAIPGTSRVGDDLSGGGGEPCPRGVDMARGLGVAGMPWRSLLMLALCLIGILGVGTEGFLFLAGICGGLLCLSRGRAVDVLLAIWLITFVVTVPLYHAYPRLLVPAIPAAILVTLRGWRLWIEDFTTGLIPGVPALSFRGASGSTVPLARAPRTWVPQVALVSVALLCVFCGRWSWVELRGVWRCWSSKASYRNFAELIARRTPPDALIVCRSQPTLWFAFRRDYVGPDDEPLLDELTDSRPCFLALDFHVHSTPKAFASVQADAARLEEVARVVNDLNPPALLNLMHPRDFWRKMAVLGGTGAGVAELVHAPFPNSPGSHAMPRRDSPWPPDLNRPGLDWIVLYRIKPQARSAAARDVEAMEPAKPMPASLKQPLLVDP